MKNLKESLHIGGGLLIGMGIGKILHLNMWGLVFISIGIVMIFLKIDSIFK